MVILKWLIKTFLQDSQMGRIISKTRYRALGINIFLRRNLRHYPHSSGKVTVRRGMACGDPSRGRKNQHLVNHQRGSPSADKSSSRVTHGTHGTHGTGLIMLRDLLLGKGGCLSESGPALAGASSILQMNLLVKVVFSSFFCDMSLWGWMLTEPGPESVRL